MDRVVREQAIEFLFEPTENLLQQYGRYVDPDEVADLRARFNGLKLELNSVFERGDIYEAYLIRSELKELCHEVRQHVEQERKQFAYLRAA